MFATSEQRTLRRRSVAFVHGLLVTALLGCVCDCLRPSVRDARQLETDPYLRVWSVDAESTSGGERFPENMHWNNSAVVHARMARLEEAEDAFKRAIAGAPADALPYLNFARFYFLCEDFEGLRRVMLQLAANNKIKSTEIFEIFARLRDLNREREAQALLDGMLAAGRERERSALLLGRDRAERGDYKSALRYYDIALAENSKSLEALAEVGSIYFLGGNFERAVYYLDAAWKLGAREEVTAFHLASALSALGKTHAALGIVTEVTGPERSEALVALHGRLLLRLDWRADVEPLLAPIKDERARERLRQSWYGGGTQDQRRAAEREYGRMY